MDNRDAPPIAPPPPTMAELLVLRIEARIGHKLLGEYRVLALALLAELLDDQQARREVPPSRVFV